VATRFATSGGVDSIVNRLKAVGTAAAEIGADTNGRGGGITPGLAAGHESKDTVTERDAHVAELTLHLVVVAAGRVGDWAAQSAREAVPWATTHLIRHAITPGVGVERVGDGDLSLGLGDGDGLITHRGRNDVAIDGILGPIPVWHTEGACCIPPSLALALGEVVDDLGDGEVPSLLEKSKVRPVPGPKKNVTMGAETRLVDQRGGEAVPGLEWTTVNTSNLVVSKPVIPALGHEPLHTEEVQVPLIGILPQLTDLKTRERLPAIEVAVAPPLDTSAADTADGDLRTNSTTLALGKRVGNIVDLGLEHIVIAAVAVSVAMAEGGGELEESEEGKDHGHHVLGLAEVGHGCWKSVANRISFLENDWKGREPKWGDPKVGRLYTNPN